MTPLPLTVIGGYLGAGKTTLINRLLAEPHGQRIMVLVNDFGAINIDADLLASATEDTLTLTNGCVCCTMGADLVMALGDALDRRPRPDHLVVEASGVADPGRIAQTALAEPDLSYAGVLTLVDALAWPGLARDPQIGAQLQTQVDRADLVLVTKAAGGPLPEVASSAPVMDLDQVNTLSPLVLDPRPARMQGAGSDASHPGYRHWSNPTPAEMTRDGLLAWIGRRPDGVFRLKGFLPGPDGRWEVQVVGQQVNLRSLPAEGPLGLIAIAPQHLATDEALHVWGSTQMQSTGQAA